MTDRSQIFTSVVSCLWEQPYIVVFRLPRVYDPLNLKLLFNNFMFSLSFRTPGTFLENKFQCLPLLFCLGFQCTRSQGCMRSAGCETHSRDITMLFGSISYKCRIFVMINITPDVVYESLANLILRFWSTGVLLVGRSVNIYSTETARLFSMILQDDRIGAYL